MGTREKGRCVRVDTVCAGCGTACRIHRWRIEKFAAVYCSRVCATTANRRLKTWECTYCGRRFETKPGRKQGARVFCSLACFSKNHKAEPDRKVDVQCSTCSKALRVYPSKAKLNLHHYCNPNCRAQFIVGANNPAYRSGFGRVPDYGPDWRRQRRAARKRDADQCQHCGVRPRTARRLHVHHIRPYYLFEGDHKRGNALENLVTLCGSCHRKAEAATRS